jgi:hypothetical protein
MKITSKKKSQPKQLPRKKKERREERSASCKSKSAPTFPHQISALPRAALPKVAFVLGGLAQNVVGPIATV